MFSAGLQKVGFVEQDRDLGDCSRGWRPADAGRRQMADLVGFDGGADADPFVAAWLPGSSEMTF